MIDAREYLNYRDGKCQHGSHFAKMISYGCNVIGRRERWHAKAGEISQNINQRELGYGVWQYTSDYHVKIPESMTNRKALRIKE
jgi:hypothetical protein